MHTSLDLFPASERARVESQLRRYQIATEEFARTSGQKSFLDDFIESYVGEDRATRWGAVDTGQNALLTMGVQLSTPGHYSRTPTLRGPTEIAAKLQEASDPLWPAMQHVEYLTYTCGSCATMPELIEEDGESRWVLRVEPQHLLWMEPDRRSPSEPAVVRRLAVHVLESKEVHAWHIWDVSDKAKPSFKVCVAEPGGKIGDDVTALVLDEATLAELANDPDAYPWRSRTGRAYMPWTVHRSREDGSLHNWCIGRGVARATMYSMMHKTLVHSVAINSSGKMAVAIGVAPFGSSVHGNSLSVDIEPNSIVFAAAQEGFIGQPTITEIGEVDTLGKLVEMADWYASGIMTSIGISPTEAARTSGNAQSAYAIHLGNATKRDEQRRRAPICRLADLRTLRQIAWALDLDPTGISIDYHEIEDSPDEKRSQADLDDRNLAAGRVSLVDLHMRDHPGMSREEAMSDLKRIRRERAELEAPTHAEAP